MKCSEIFKGSVYHVCCLSINEKEHWMGRETSVQDPGSAAIEFLWHRSEKGFFKTSWA